MTHCKKCESSYCSISNCLTEKWIFSQNFADHTFVPFIDDEQICKVNKSRKEEQCFTVEESTVTPSANFISGKNGELKIQNTNNMINDQAQSNIKAFPNKAKVYITHVVNNKKVFVRSAHTNDNLKYLKLMKMVSNGTKKSSPVLALPLIGNIIAAPYDRVYYRAMVLSANKSSRELSVNFIDFGNTETIKLSEARYLSQNLQVIKPMIMHISLKYIDKSNTKALKYLATNIEKFILNNDGNKESSELGINEYELIIARTGTSINKHFTTEKLIQKLPTVIESTAAESECEIISTKRIEYKVLKGKNINAMIIDNSNIGFGFVTCISDDDMQQFVRNDQIVNELGNSLTRKPYSPNRCEEICLVKCVIDSQWYRASLLKDTIAGTSLMYFIDYGYCVPVQCRNIFRIPDQLLFPCLTVQCFIDGIPWLNNDVILPESDILAMKYILPAYELFKFKEVTINKECTYSICKLF